MTGVSLPGEMPPSDAIHDAVVADDAWQPVLGRRPVRVYVRTVRQAEPGRRGTQLELACVATGWEAALLSGSDRISLGTVETADELDRLVRVLERRRG